jgi:hypothetical protein
MEKFFYNFNRVFLFLLIIIGGMFLNYDTTTKDALQISIDILWLGLCFHQYIKTTNKN